MWDEALKIFAISFGGTFAVLIILTIGVHLTSVIARRYESWRNKP